MHLLNLTYGWQLEDTNTVQRNTPAVDLIYKAKSLVVQVSSTNTSVKIQNSLDKLDAQYKGYNFKFVSIAKPAENNLPKDLEIVFNPQEDIFDIDSLLNTFVALSPDKQKNIYEFVKKELAFDSEEIKLETGIAHVINELSDVNLKDSAVDFDTTSFLVDKKIIKNNLSVFKNIIEQYDVYCITIDKIYNAYDKMGNNKSLAVLHTINKEYLSLKAKYTGDDLYQAIAGNIKVKLLLSANLKQFNEEDLELYVDIILVNAFIRCKIFEKPW